MEINIPMFTYFDIYAAKNNFNYPFAEISMFQKDWNTTSEKKVATHPPLEEIKITIQGAEVIASPFKRTNPKEDETRYPNLKDIKGLQQQNNFTNQILGTISSQLDRIEKNIPKSKEIDKEKPLFRTPEYNKPIKLGNKNNDLIKALAQKLESLNITNPSTSKRQINFLSGSETESSVSEEQTQNSNQEDDQINRIKYQKTWQQGTINYYPRPTPSDLLYEERLPPKAMYNDNYIYEWNIDGLFEHETLNVLRQMLIAATAYLMENDDHNATQLLISGFSGTLRSWWDNCLNEEERKFLQTSTNDEGEQNAVHRTVYAITKHFVGDPRILQERSSEILQNLRCRTLSDFRWYHDVFISKVMIRHDARAPYWKERFLYGLPRALTK